MESPVAKPTVIPTPADVTESMQQLHDDIAARLLPNQIWLKQVAAKASGLPCVPDKRMRKLSEEGMEKLQELERTHAELGDRLVPIVEAITQELSEHLERVKRTLSILGEVSPLACHRAYRMLANRPAVHSGALARQVIS